MLVLSYNARTLRDLQGTFTTQLAPSRTPSTYCLRVHGNLTRLNALLDLSLSLYQPPNEGISASRAHRSSRHLSHVFGRFYNLLLIAFKTANFQRAFNQHCNKLFIQCLTGYFTNLAHLFGEINFASAFF